LKKLEKFHSLVKYKENITLNVKRPVYTERTMSIGQRKYYIVQVLKFKQS